MRNRFHIAAATKSWLKSDFVVMIAVALTVCAPFALAGPNLDDLVAKLGGKDDAARSEARQFLPRYGAAAVPKVLPLLANEDANIWNAASNVLTDIASEVSTPGRERERKEVAKYFMTLLDAKQPAAIKERGLRLLPLVIPEGFSVAPVADLLKDREWREKAKTALQETGTKEAASALVKALSSADPEFQYALLNSLSFLHAPQVVSKAAKLVYSSDARVRSAALRALAWTGETKYAPLARDVMAKADDATRREAADAAMLLADAIASKGGYDAARGLYVGALEASKDVAVQSAAIAGLGRHADPKAVGAVVPEIMKALTGPNGRDLEPAALAAFEALPGKDAAEALIAAYPTATLDLRAGMLGVFGRKHDLAYLDVLKEATKSSEEPLRNEAYAALAESRLPQAVDVFLAMDGNKWFVLENLKCMALDASMRGDTAMMGAAYAGLFRVSDSGVTTAYALNCMVDSGAPDALDLIMKALEQNKLEGAPMASLAKAAKALLAAKRTDDAKKLVDFLVARATTPDVLQQALSVASAVGMPELAKRLGFIKEWKLVGPFPWANDGFKTVNIGEPNVDTNAKYKVKGQELEWDTCKLDNPMSGVNLIQELGNVTAACGYAFATITLPADADAVIRAGSDDGIKIWVNGESVWEKDVDRGTAIDQDKAPAKLKKGENKILVRVNQGGGGWNFILRLTKPDGAPLPFE